MTLTNKQWQGENLDLTSKFNRLLGNKILLKRDRSFTLEKKQFQAEVTTASMFWDTPSKEVTAKALQVYCRKIKNLKEIKYYTNFAAIT